MKYPIKYSAATEGMFNFYRRAEWSTIQFEVICVQKRLQGKSCYHWGAEIRVDSYFLLCFSFFFPTTIDLGNKAWLL